MIELAARSAFRIAHPDTFTQRRLYFTTGIGGALRRTVSGQIGAVSSRWTLGLTGAADTIIVIDRQPSGGFVFDVRGRDVEAAQLAALFGKDTCRWTIVGDAGSVRRSAEREAVLSIFRDAGEPLTVELVTAALREGVTSDRRGVTKSRDAVKQILGRMAKSGDLRRVEKGRYELPTNPESLSH